MRAWQLLLMEFTPDHLPGALGERIVCDPIQDRFEKAVYHEFLGDRFWDPSRQHVENFLFVDFASCRAVAAFDIVGLDFQAWQ